MPWKRNIKCSTLINGTFSPNLSAMPGNDSFHIGKSDARTLKFILAMKPLEDAEKLISISHVESYTIALTKKTNSLSSSLNPILI